jgi:hypothetical protein
MAVSFEARVFRSQLGIWRAPLFRSSSYGGFSISLAEPAVALQLASPPSSFDRLTIVLFQVPFDAREPSRFGGRYPEGPGALGVAPRAARFVPERSLNPSGETSKPRQYIISPLVYRDWTSDQQATTAQKNAAPRRHGVDEQRGRARRCAPRSWFLRRADSHGMRRRGACNQFGREPDRGRRRLGRRNAAARARGRT